MHIPLNDANIVSYLLYRIVIPEKLAVFRKIGLICHFETHFWSKSKPAAGIL